MTNFMGGHRLQIHALEQAVPPLVQDFVIITAMEIVNPLAIIPAVLQRETVVQHLPRAVVVELHARAVAEALAHLHAVHAALRAEVHLQEMFVLAAPHIVHHFVLVVVKVAAHLVPLAVMDAAEAVAQLARVRAIPLVIRGVVVVVPASVKHLAAERVLHRVIKGLLYENI